MISRKNGVGLCVPPAETHNLLTRLDLSAALKSLQVLAGSSLPAWWRIFVLTSPKRHWDWIPGQLLFSSSSSPEQQPPGRYWLSPCTLWNSSRGLIWGPLSGCLLSSLDGCIPSPGKNCVLSGLTRTIYSQNGECSECSLKLRPRVGRKRLVGHSGTEAGIFIGNSKAFLSVQQFCLNSLYCAVRIELGLKQEQLWLDAAQSCPRKLGLLWMSRRIARQLRSWRRDWQPKIVFWAFGWAWKRLASSPIVARAENTRCVGTIWQVKVEKTKWIITHLSCN